MSSINNILLDNKEIESLFYKIKEGEKEALALLYDYTKSAVFGYALSKIKNYHQAEDITQDVYLSIWNNINKYKSEGKPMAWIYTIIKNKVLDYFRKNSNNETVVLDDYIETLEKIESVTMEDKLILKMAMEILSEEENEILILHNLYGFKHKEIGVSLGLKTSTVLSKYNRAIKKIQVSLGRY